MNKKPMIFFRCDAGPKYGLGHLMRCIAIAQGFQRAGYKENIFFLRKAGNDDLYEELLGRNGFRYVFLPNLAKGLQFDFEEYFHQGKMNLMIFDNYDVTAEQMISYKQKNKRLVAIDDLADREFFVDLIINQNIGSESLVYKTKGPVRLLLGSPYVLLRNNFLQIKNVRNQNENGAKPLDEKHVFMSFGGGDTFSRIKRVLRMFHKLDQKLETKIVVDFALPNNQILLSQVRREFSGLRKIFVHMIIGKYDLAYPMNNADFALTAAGTSVFELAFLGTPQMVFIIDKNQEITGNKVNKTGIGICLGDIEGISETEFVKTFLEFLENESMKRNMSSLGKEYIDGRGAERVVDEVISFYDLAA